MTEFDLALDFLQTYVREAAAAAEEGESLDDGKEFREFCGDLGVPATGQRLELVRDLASVIKEWLMADDSEEDDTTHTIAAVSLLEGLERYGWRMEFLSKDIAA